MLDQSNHIFNQNAIDVLMADHKKIKELFSDYADLARAEHSPEKKEKLAKTICEELTYHSQIEEEIFYPQVREALLDEKMMMDEAEVEHRTFKELIDEIESMDVDEELYDAKVIVLGEYVEHHVKEEESEMFSRVRNSDLNLEEMGTEMRERRKELESNVASSILDSIKDTIGIE